MHYDLAATIDRFFFFHGMTGFSVTAVRVLKDRQGLFGMASPIHCERAVQRRHFFSIKHINLTPTWWSRLWTGFKYVAWSFICHLSILFFSSF